MEKEIIYTASYLYKNTWFRFVGKGMKQEYKSLEKLKSELNLLKKQSDNIGEFKIYKHEVELIEVI